MRPRDWESTLLFLVSRSAVKYGRGLSAALVVLMVASIVVGSATDDAIAQGDDAVVINEIVAANDTFVDQFGETPDWIELQNNGATTVDLAGWTIADNGGPWLFPSRLLAPGERLVVFASGRDLTDAQLHTDFALKRSGETITLANSDGALADTITYPAIQDDVSYGRDAAGGIGVLLEPTPNNPNSAHAPSSVEITTPPQTFQGSLPVSMVATTQAGEHVRFTTDGTAVTSTSQVYSGPFQISGSTVVRAAVVGADAIGPESSAGYTAIGASLANFSSDIPLVVVDTSSSVGLNMQDAIVSVIDRGLDGRASIFDQVGYFGFAGVRFRGGSSLLFDKKQYKLELWSDPLGDEIAADLLGLGRDSDWALYAPGRYDRAMINNPFMYELAKRVGVVSPDYQFVELFVDTSLSQTVDAADYVGLYVLRETIKVGDERVDITEHTPAAAGGDFGFIMRYDWPDTCCAELTTTQFGTSVAIDTPGVGDITAAQLSYLDGWWQSVRDAATTNFAAADQVIDFDSVVDHWLLEMLAMDIDILRASHYLHQDVGGQLQGGPVWDYDRGLGAADSRIDDIDEARSWEPNGPGGHSYLSDVYEDLWQMPEVQARLRARWAQLRSANGVFSDAGLEQLIFELGGEIAEAYGREDALWGPNSNYGSRFGGLNGELNHMRDWVAARTEWLDNQFLNAASPPVITVPATGVDFATNVALSYQVDLTSAGTVVFEASGLPEGLTISTSTGAITGTVAFGDSYGTFPVEVTVTNSFGATATDVIEFRDPDFVTPPASAMVLNEFNAVAPGQLLDAAGSDSFFGAAGGNGGDWFEVVTVNDNLDIRGWRFDVWSRSDLGNVVQTASLRLGQDALLTDIRAGSIITVAESVPDDLSYNPAAGDWTINLQSNDAGEGALWSNQTNFDTNHKRWRLVIRDATGRIRGFVGGETSTFAATSVSGLSSDEVLGLDVDPSSSAQSYAPSTNSTFGDPNLVVGGVQDFAALRPEVALAGDVNCSSSLNVTDALVIAQFSVGNRQPTTSCPLVDIATEIFVPTADVNTDGLINVTDALLVAQCSVGNPNVLCPVR